MGPNFTEWLVTVHIFMYSYGIPMCSCGSQQYICIVMGHNIIYVHRYGSLLLPSKQVTSIFVTGSVKPFRIVTRLYSLVSCNFVMVAYT